MQKTTFKLTNQELDFISDPNLMRLKQKLVRNLADALNGLGIWVMQTHFPNSGGNHKITRGENYLDQPYVVLDMPQLKAGALAGKLRLMCWWGHYMSLQYFFDVSPEKIAQLAQLSITDAVVLTGLDLYNNDLAHADFTPLKQLKSEQLLPIPHSKICIQLGFDRFEQLPEVIDAFLAEVKNLQ